MDFHDRIKEGLTSQPVCRGRQGARCCSRPRGALPWAAAQTYPDCGRSSSRRNCLAPPEALHSSPCLKRLPLPQDEVAFTCLREALPPFLPVVTCFPVLPPAWTASSLLTAGPAFGPSCIAAALPGPHSAVCKQLLCVLQVSASQDFPDHQDPRSCPRSMLSHIASPVCVPAGPGLAS